MLALTMIIAAHANSQVVFSPVFSQIRLEARADFDYFHINQDNAISDPLGFHGKYFNFSKQEWVWQRPRLFCTTEDMFTQTFVVPYLMPMLQNAGAVVFSPRERDWQKQEVIIDNDFIWDGSRYEERVSTYHWQYGGVGFGNNQEGYENGENPFRRGTYQITEATKDKRTTSDVVWIPEIPVEDDYAVYVSYQTLPNSIPDATYTVRHGGTETALGFTSEHSISRKAKRMTTSSDSPTSATTKAL